jgi:hypothetical protein
MIDAAIEPSPLARAELESPRARALRSMTEHHMALVDLQYGTSCP